MARSTQHDSRPDEGPAASPGRFDLLPIVMVCAYLLSALTNGRWTDALRVLLFTVVALLALRASLVPRRTARLIVAAVLAGSAIMLTLSFATESGRGIANIWAGLVLLLAVVVIVHRVLSIRTVTLQNIYGALKPKSGIAGESCGASRPARGQRTRSTDRCVSAARGWWPLAPDRKVVMSGGLERACSGLPPEGW